MTVNKLCLNQQPFTTKKTETQYFRQKATQHKQREEKKKKKKTDKVEHKPKSPAPKEAKASELHLGDSNWNFFQVGYPVDTPTKTTTNTQTVWTGSKKIS